MNFFRTIAFCLLIALLALIAAYVRVSVSSAELLWLDELHTSWTVGGTFAEVAERASLGNQQPVFFWLTKGSVEWLGHSEFSLRLISILASVGTLIAASLLTWKWTQSAIASSAVAFLLVFDSQFLFYGSEARPYALVQLLGVIQVTLLAKTIWPSTTKANLESQESSQAFSWMPFLGLAIASVALIYTHLTSIWVFVAEIVFLFGWILRARIRQLTWRIPLTRLTTTAAVVSIAVLPLVGQTSMIMDRKANWESVSSLFSLARDCWPALFVLILIPVIYVAIERDVRRTSAVETKDELAGGRVTRSKLVLVFLWAVVPLFLVAMLHTFRIAPLALFRYTLVGAVAFPIFAGLCIGRLSSKWNRAALAAVVIIATAMLNPLTPKLLTHGVVERMRIEDWRTPIDEINANEPKSSHPVFLFANVIEDSEAYTIQDQKFQEYLLFPLGGLDQIANKGRTIEAGPTLERIHFRDDQIQQVKEQGGAWVIVRAQDDLILEIVNELGDRLANLLDANLEPRVSILDDSISPVRLISIDLVPAE